MTENDAKKAIIGWAKRHYKTEADNLTPEVDTLSLRYDSRKKVWEADLWVSCAEDTIHVLFRFDENYEPLERRLHVESVEE